MKDSNYHRLVQTSVTVFIHKDDKYLFLKRRNNMRIDPGRLNGIGGRLEPGEDYLNCCIREVAEETGYIITPKNIQLSGIVKLEGGYPEDWVMCFYKIKVDDFNIPRGTKTEDGELIWLDKDKVLDSEYDLVDDINYCFKDIVDEKRLFFLTAKLDSNQVIEKTSISYLDK
jgi:8-oxo-dGTP diphosphatase